MRPLRIAHVREARDTAPVPVETTWPKLSQRLRRTPPVRGDLVPPGADAGRLRNLKARLPAWIPAEFTPGAKRNASGVIALHLLVLDYDSGATVEDERQRWSRYEHLGHTSWSHTKTAPKFRLVLPLAHPVPVRWWGRVFEWVQRQAPIDPQTRNPDRIYFLPALKSPASPWSTWANTGPWLDLDGPTLDPTAAELEQQRRADAVARLRDRPPMGNPTREAERQARLLREDAPTREAFALARGGVIRQRRDGRVALGLLCPGCGLPSVWMPIDVHKMSGARCNHANSCGWAGPLTELP